MNLDYVAGFFDGEGSFCISLTKTQETKYGYSFKPVIEIAQKTPNILINIQNFLGFGSVRKQSYVVSSKEDCGEFLNLVGNKLEVKQEHAQIFREILDLLETSKSKPQGYTTPRDKCSVLAILDLIERLRTMNKKGMRAHCIADIRKQVMEFDEKRYEDRIAAYKQKRIDHLHKIQESRKLKIEKKILLHLYVEEKLSGLKVAKILKCEKSAVYNRLKEFQIPLRSQSEAGKLRISNLPGRRRERGVQHPG